MRNHPTKLNVSSEILYGEKDNFQNIETINPSGERIDEKETIMINGEHRFDTDEKWRS